MVVNNMSKYPRPVVASKYGNRPLIEVPAVSIQRKSYSASNVQQQAIPTNYIQPGYAALQPSLINQQAYQTLQQNPYAPLYVSPAPSPQQQYMSPGQFPQQPYMSTGPLSQQQYVPPAPAPLPQQAPPLNRNWSNVANNSNFVPYVDSVQLPQTQPSYGGPVMPNIPGYNQQQQFIPNMQQYGNPAAQNGFTDAKGEVHHFYGPNGTPMDPTNPDFTRVWGGNFQQLRQSNGPTDFVLQGTVEYGRLTSVKIKDSKFSFRDVPEILINELKRVYGEVPKTKVKVIASRGEYNIYAMPYLDDLRHESYVYEPHERYHANYKTRPVTETDHYTKLYSREQNVRLATERRDVISQGHYDDSDDEARYPISDTDARRRWRKLKNTIKVRRE